VPGFAEGGAAFFPTFGALFALGSFALLRRKGGGDTEERPPEQSVLFWLGFALLSFVFALGPTITLLGRPLVPGPWRLFGRLPVLDSMRGIHRWDQWFDLALFAATALALAALFRSRARAGSVVAAVTVALLTFDLWPRTVVADPVPPPSPVNDLVLALPRDAIVATYPFERSTSERTWAEQMYHGRRVLTGYQTFPPPIHYWVSERSGSVSVRETLQLYRELGAAAFEIVLSDLDPRRQREAEEIAANPSLVGAVAAERRKDRILLQVAPREPILLDPLVVGGLVFHGGSATAAAPPGRLAFRLRSASWPATVIAGGISSRATLTWHRRPSCPAFTAAAAASRGAGRRRAPDRSNGVTASATLSAPEAAGRAPACPTGIPPCCASHRRRACSRIGRTGRGRSSFGRRDRTPFPYRPRS
jgi:hypothetical protein